MIAFEEPLGHLSDGTIAKSQIAVQSPLYEAALLMDLLGGTTPVLTPDIDWHVFHNMAARNGVLNYVFDIFEKTDTQVPDFFAESARESQSAATSRAEELRRLLEAFANQQIDLLPLKGPALSLRLYGDASLRTSSDLDLLVRRKDFLNAESLLISLGFFPHNQLSGYDRKFFRNGLLVELHFELGDKRYLPLDTEGAWSRAHAITFHEVPAFSMSKIDLALYLCCHGAKHGFSRLIWILDSVQSLQGWHNWEYESLLKLAQQRNLTPWLLFASAVLRTAFPHRFPKTMEKLFSSSPLNKRMERTVTRMLSDNFQKGLNDYRLLYLQIEPSIWKRLRYSLSYFSPTAEDRQWARNHHIPAGLMLMLRPFRLFGKHGVRKIFHTFYPQS